MRPVRRSTLLILLATPLLACGSPPAPTIPAAPAATAPVASASAPPPTAPASSASYTGLGAASVSPEVLAKYAAPPLNPAVAHRIQAMLDLRTPAPVVISSDGKSLFCNWSVSGVRQVWRIDGPDHFAVQLTGGEDATVVKAVTPDGKTLVLERDRNGEENPGVYVQKSAGGPLTKVQHKPGVQTLAQFVSDDGRWVYFASNDQKPDSYAIYRYDLANGTRETVFAQDGLWEVSDHLPDGKLLLRKQTGGVSSEYSEWDPVEKSLRALFGQGEKEDWSAMYGGAPGEIVARAPHGADFYRLWKWKDGAFTALSPEVKHDVNSFQVDPTHQRIVYLMNEDGYLRLHAMSAKSYKPIAEPKLPPSEVVNAADTSANGQFTPLRISSSRLLPTSYVYDWKSGKVTRWINPAAPEIDVSRFAARSLESYPARDGTKIPMWVRRPASCTQPCPVIVEFHGGPESQAGAGFGTWGQMFVNAGFIFVEPNVRGSSGYGKAWVHADDGAKRLDVITDIEDAAKYVRSAWAAGGKAPKVGITGGSYGGYATLVGMTMFAGAYDAGASIVGPSSLVTFVRNTAPYRRILRASEYGNPDKDLDVMTKLSPMTYVDRVSAPLLLIQGASDPRVPVGEAVQIHDALAARHVDAPLIIFPDEGHGAAKRQNLVQEIGQVIAFFQRHLG